MNADTPPPPPPVSPPSFAPDSTVRLWNPNAAALWSVLLSPAFGAFLHAQNWRTLGDRERARANMIWFFIVIVIVVVATFLPAIPSAAHAPLGIGLLAGWYYSQGKKQVEYVKGNFPAGYKKRSIYFALLIGLLAFVLFIGTLAFAAGGAAAIKGASPDRIAEVLSQDVKKSIVSEWSKHPELANATVERVSLSPEDGSSTEFKGEVDATLDGQRQQLPIKVSFDPKTKRMSWRILPKE